MTTSDLSRYEFCPKLPKLYADLEPELLPIRESMRRHFANGLRQTLSNLLPSAPNDFLSEASSRGFIYPNEGNPYYIAQDYSCWLDGVIRIVEEMGIDAEPAPTIPIYRSFVKIDNAYLSPNGVLHLFRISDSDDAKWDELFAQLIPDVKEIQIHSFPLPTLRKGRLPSPLVLIYKHPAMNILRLAPLEGERFSAKWKRSARWEDRYDWNEWREGINRDQCLDRILIEKSIIPSLDPDEAESIKIDAATIASFIPRQWPRQRESCPRCTFHLFCHGDKNDRKRFTTRDDYESVFQVRAEPQTTLSIQP